MTIKQVKTHPTIKAPWIRQPRQRIQEKTSQRWAKYHAYHKENHDTASTG